MYFIDFTEISSLPDRFGNCYYAIELTNNTNQSTYAATISGDNARAALFQYIGRDWEYVRGFCNLHTQRLGIREFNRFTKNLPHAGCTGEEISAHLKAAGALPDFWDCLQFLESEGMQIDNHESDLYLPVTRSTSLLLSAFGLRGTVFTSNIDGKLWYDLPFQNRDWWNNKARV